MFPIFGIADEFLKGWGDIKDKEFISQISRIMITTFVIIMGYVLRNISALFSFFGCFSDTTMLIVIPIIAF